jgi:hypothetical protein
MHAINAGLDAPEYEDNETKQRRRQILHPLESIHRRGIIGERQFLAGMRFRDVIVGSMSPTRVTSTLTPFHDHGSNNESVTFRKDRQQELARAIKAIKDPSAATFIKWMETAEHMDTGLLDLGKALTGMVKHAIIKKAAVDALDSCLNDLSKHFQIR